MGQSAAWLLWELSDPVESPDSQLRRAWGGPALPLVTVVERAEWPAQAGTGQHHSCFSPSLFFPLR